MTMNYPVHIVDDDEAVREALCLLLETIGYQVQSYEDPVSFLNHRDKLSAGCILMDIRMPMISGLKVQEKLIDAECDWPVIIISGHGDINACRKAFKNGAIDFLSKPVDEQDLIDAIEKAEEILTRNLNKNAEITETKSLLKSLTPREREVLDMVSWGWTTKEIAASLRVSPRTIESHRAHIAEKLGTTSVAEMARMIIETQN